MTVARLSSKVEHMARQIRTTQLTVKVNDATVERINRLKDHVARITMLPESQADVMREALSRGLMSLEREAAKEAGGTG